MLLSMLGWSLLALQVTASGATHQTAPGRLSWADAEALSRKLDAIEKNHQRPPQRSASQSVLVTERELNSYLNLKLGPKMPPGVSDVDIRLDRERIDVKGILDLEKVTGKVSAPHPWSPLALLTGRVPVQIRGRLLARGGFGSIAFEDVRLGGVPVPNSVLEQMVLSATRTAENPQGFDINAPFRLPYLVQRVRIEPGQAYLDF